MIASKFTNARNKYTLLPEDRVALVREYADAGGLFFECTVGSTGLITSALRRTSTMSVALVTLNEASNVYGLKTVEDFWSGIARDDGLVKGDPRKTAISYLTRAREQGGNMEGVAPIASARYIAGCFNAWVKGQSIHRVSVKVNEPIKILGTRWTGKPTE